MKINDLPIFSNLDTIKDLETYWFAVGLSPSANGKFVPVKLMNLDGTLAEHSLPIDEALFFIEYGTVNIPAQSILSLAIEYVSTELAKFLDKLTDELFSENFSKDLIYIKLIEFENLVNNNLSTVLKENKKIYFYISNLLKNNNLTNNQFFPDLSNYIKCMIYKK